MKIPFKMFGLSVLSFSLMVCGCGEKKSEKVSESNSGNRVETSFKPLVAKDAKIVLALNLDKEQTFKIIDSYLQMASDMHMLEEDDFNEAKEKIEAYKKDIFADCDKEAREFVEKSGLRDAKLTWAVVSVEDFQIAKGKPQPAGLSLAIGGKLDLEKLIAAAQGEKDCDVSFEKMELDGETAWHIVPTKDREASELKELDIDPYVGSLSGRLVLFATSRDALAKQIRLYRKGMGKGDALNGFSAANGEFMRLKLSGIGDFVQQNVTQDDLQQIGDFVPDGDKIIGGLQNLTIDTKVKPDGKLSETIRLKTASEENADTIRTSAKAGLMVATAQMSNDPKTPKGVTQLIKDVKIGGSDGVVEVQSGISSVGLLAFVAVPNYMNYLADARITTTRSLIKNIEVACQMYNMKHGGKYPSQLSELQEGDDDNPPLIDGGIEDPWGNEIKYERKGKRIYLTSAGPDGDFGTEDDITNIERNKKK